jgi:CRP-like cAMP-binding protein
MLDSQSEIFKFLQKNPLFHGISDQQLMRVASIAELQSFHTGEVIFHEHAVSDYLYIIKNGSVEISKLHKKDHQQHHLATLGAGDVVGEMSLFDDAPRSASVIAAEPTILIALKINKLKNIPDKKSFFTKIIYRLIKAHKSEPQFYNHLMHNLAKNLSSRMRQTNEKMIGSLRRELDHEKERTAIGSFIIAIIVCLVTYIIALKVMQLIDYDFYTTSLMTIPLIAFISGVVIWLMRSSGYPLEFYGLTLHDWRGSLKNAALLTPALIILLLAFKWALIKTGYYHHQLIETRFSTFPNISHWTIMLEVSIYILFVPFQELVVRSALQSSFQEFLTGKNKALSAIILSNLLFSIVHMHVSMLLSLAVFVPGLFWGWMYARHRTIVGPIISHIIFGATALFIIGIG